MTVAKLGTAVTVAYASTYYLPAAIAKDMAQTLDVQQSIVFLAFSFALLISAILGPIAGRFVDAVGGRKVLSGTSLVFAAGLVSLACAQGPWTLFVAWLVLGVAMSAGFYEVAFSTLVRIYGTDARSAITGITLIAGFASTVGWPLTTWINFEFGWRWVCLAWAAIHLFIALPLNLSLPTSTMKPEATSSAGFSDLDKHEISPIAAAWVAPPSTAWLLAFVFGATWFVSTAMAAHLPRLLQAGGISLAAAIAIASLVGPAQVIGRLLEYGLLRNVNPLLSAHIASISHAIGAVIFMAVGVPAGAAFTILHGAGNGVMTIANGTLPLIFFGPAGYGARQGKLMMPARFAQAMAPYFFGLAIDGFGVHALDISIALGCLAFVALLALKTRPRLLS